MSSAEQPRRRCRDEAGQVALLIVGLATVLAMTVAVVVDASAAYLQRQSLDTLADSAALAGADLAATGEETYVDGLAADRLALDAELARAGVRDHLAATGAHRAYPGLSWVVTVDAATSTVTVRLRAPLDLPLTVPGSPTRAVVAATGSAVVSPS
ncbi:pilus assembly protein TadG-related protein [Nocardioides sp.]|uniref:pilus assembly protein TadG-related protein n=1 Tax=Nocardioides sp. TaxID=35761 RepID=UPI003564DCBB